ncbi:hypothetical protein [Salegentibacter flavus]|uniref:SMODS and SLOG-associating 2TM effector domain-containing protein n=1 Tax=Salegentibacter flavus TaxID=287099 RepID=A0A1I5DLT4_9FLAO|nr:hypothetical protein [Salegentibacter flavus]SFO00087.1 hypothetical protein SAMN05660413_03382 [Salegentibacter flavus]
MKKNKEDQRGEYFKELQNGFQKTEAKWLDKKYSFLRWLVITALGFLSVFVAFSDVDNPDSKIFFFYTTTIITVCLAILFTGITLFGEVKQNKLLADSYKMVLVKFKEGSLILEDIEGRLPTWYMVSESLAYICYFLFLMSLIFFSIVKIL